MNDYYPSEGGRNPVLSQAVLENLFAILSPDQEIRSSAENQIKTLEVLDEYGIILVELTTDVKINIGIRQLASVMLKKYVETHWTDQSEKFTSPEVSLNSKACIRQMLLPHLSEPLTKVRSSIAYVISTIAAWDWPDSWPDLFPALVSALSSQDVNLVHGCMRVLTEFSCELTDLQMPHVAPVLLPHMCNIFVQANRYSMRTRGRAINIFEISASLIAQMNELDKGVAKKLLYPYLPHFIDGFVSCLQCQDESICDYGLKTEVIKSLTTLVRNFPGYMSKCIDHLLQPIWSLLTTSAQLYSRSHVNSLEEVDYAVDSDGEVLGFESLVLNIFEFIHAMLDSSKFKNIVRKSDQQILKYAIIFMQLTNEQLEKWSTNASLYVEDEDVDTYSYSIRISSRQLVMAIINKFPNESPNSLGYSIGDLSVEVNNLKLVNDLVSWKLEEVMVMTLGLAAPSIIILYDEKKLTFDIISFLRNLVFAKLSLNVNPFLIGQCLWTGSRYAKILPPDLLQGFLEATILATVPAQTNNIRVCAIRATYEFAIFLKKTSSLLQFRPFLSNVVEGLLDVATHFTSDVLTLCLQTLCLVLEVDEKFTASVEEKVSTLAINHFLKDTSDPVLVGLCEDVFTILSKNELCIDQLQLRILPSLITILELPADKIPMGMQSTTLDIITCLIRHSHFPLPEILINRVLPAVYQCALLTDDNSTMQSSGECLRAYVSCSLVQISQWRDNQGRNGVVYIVQIISRLLDPKTSEYTASQVGRLVSILISKLGSDLGPDLERILKSVLAKLQQAETSTVIQSLVMVFAQLVHSQLQALLEFLCNVPSPEGNTALEFVLREWCAKQHLFVGDYERKISSLALCKLLEHAVISNDQRLNCFNVPGEQIIQPQQAIRTRSKTVQAPDEWTNVPILVKIYKLLIYELSNQMEINQGNCNNSNGYRKHDDDEENDTENDDDDDEEKSENNFEDVIKSIGCDDDNSDNDDTEVFEDGEDFENDADAINDPLNQVNLQAYLTDFLSKFSEHPSYPHFIQHHNPSEKQVLNLVGINV